MKQNTITMQQNHYTITTCSSRVPLPSRPPANIIHELFFIQRKAGMSGQFGDVMMMSGGRGLAGGLG